MIRTVDSGYVVVRRILDAVRPSLRTRLGAPWDAAALPSFEGTLEPSSMDPFTA